MPSWRRIVGVEVDALADQPILLEHEQRAEAHLELAPGRRQAAEGAEVGAVEHRLDDHGVVGVVEREQLVALVGERRPRLLEVARDLRRGRRRRRRCAISS